MAPLTPVTLLGDNLGQRHRHLNSLVREAKESGVSFQDVEALPEQSPIDRLFKIDLAIQLRNIDYIIRNLKDDDMLYVSRALKSTWLLDHRDIINPKYLEDVLFRVMITPAVSKMKHWLYTNLRDAAMCQEFYQYYKENTFEFAIKFLSHCSREFILEEVPKILTKLSTHYLKVLCETCPRVAKIYYDLLETDEDLKTQYLRREQVYYNSVKCVLKTDPDVFLNIMEKYFNTNCFNRLSSSATDYILRHHKSRFENKLELYVAYFLHIPTLADRLNEQECQEVVLKLARAKYLQNWFRYKVVESMIKRLSPDKRAAFKKRVFVDKDVGECVDKWPYEIPSPPTRSDFGPNIFEDQDFVSICGITFEQSMLRKRKCSSYKMCCAEVCMADACMIRMKTDLDRLFDEFRFIGFERALHDLGQRLGATGSIDRRRDMFLVLVSKAGGRSEAVVALLLLAARHSNEPAHSRAAVLRSLVKRANVWRLPADAWQYFLDFGHGLGLDGSKSEAPCREGLHAVVIRQLLAGDCEQAVNDAFLGDFSTLAEYSLKPEERTRVALGLQNMLLAAATDAAPTNVAAERLGQLLDVLKVHRVSVDPESPAIKAIMSLASRDAEVARPLLERLYDARIARRELLRVNLAFRRDGAALLNVLRHDPPALDLIQVVEMLAAGESCFDGFISKLVIYFDQKEVTTQLRTAIKENIAKKQNVKLARPLAGLMGISLTEEIREFDAAGTDFVKFTAALRASAHRARPVINLAEWGWRKAGVKAVATRAMCCREVDRAKITRALAVERRTVRVALALSVRSKEELLLDTFRLAAKLRPTAALRAALPYFHRCGARADLKVWDIVKPLISSVDLSSVNVRFRRLLRNTDWIPSTIKPDYCITLYFAINKISKTNAEQLLRELSNILHTSDESIESILIQILENNDKDTTAISYPAIFVRYLMLSRNDEDLDGRFEKVGDRFLERLDSLRREKDSFFQERLDQTMDSLKYNAAFLDTKFTSCLAVIERILAWMRKFMPKDEYFRKYVQVHLTMLYFKAVRQSMKQMPEVFGDPKRRKSEGVDALGFIFGRYIAKEIAALVCTYFDSIVELYTSALVDYLSDNFMYGRSRAKLTVSVLKGIMAEGVGNQRRVAVYVFKDRQYDMEDSVRKEIQELMTKDKQIEFFVNAELLT